MARTKDSSLSDAEICRSYGWTAGTKLTGDEGFGPTVILITAIGELKILAKIVSHSGKPQIGSEMLWSLRERDWDRFEGVKPMRRETDFKKRDA